jgi:hypothetical protein
MAYYYGVCMKSGCFRIPVLGGCGYCAKHFYKEFGRNPSINSIIANQLVVPRLMIPKVYIKPMSRCMHHSTVFNGELCGKPIPFGSMFCEFHTCPICKGDKPRNLDTCGSFSCNVRYEQSINLNSFIHY